MRWFFYFIITIFGRKFAFCYLDIYGNNQLHRNIDLGR